MRCFVMLQILISYVADLTFSLAVTRGECVHELDGACCGGQSFEVWWILPGRH